MTETTYTITNGHQTWTETDTETVEEYAHDEEYTVTAVTRG